MHILSYIPIDIFVDQDRPFAHQYESVSMPLFFAELRSSAVKHLCTDRLALPSPATLLRDDPTLFSRSIALNTREL
jgi:hypothetical protein